MWISLFKQGNLQSRPSPPSSLLCPTPVPKVSPLPRQPIPLPFSFSFSSYTSPQDPDLNWRSPLSRWHGLGERGLSSWEQGNVLVDMLEPVQYRENTRSQRGRKVTPLFIEEVPGNTSEPPGWTHFGKYQWVCINPEVPYNKGKETG